MGALDLEYEQGGDKDIIATTKQILYKNMHPIVEDVNQEQG